MHTIIFDLETTGTDPAKDRILQYAFVRNGDEPMAGYVNPGQPIPAESTAIHGITDDMVSDSPPFAKIASKIAAYLDGCDAVAGFGCLRFDVPLLAEEFARANVSFDWSKIEIIDAGNIFKEMEGRKLSDAVRFYCGREHDGAHDAMVDVMATQAVLSAQLDRYPALKGKSLAELAAISRHNGPKLADPHGKLAWIGGRVCFNTHRNKGVPVQNEISYAQWMLRSDFPAATCDAIERELSRIEAQRVEAVECGGNDQSDGHPF
jgi:DNA polymerase-3 subunit epsilon